MGVHGPLEEALLGTTIQNADEPVEVHASAPNESSLAPSLEDVPKVVPKIDSTLGDETPKQRKIRFLNDWLTQIKDHRHVPRKD